VSDEQNQLPNAKIQSTSAQLNGNQHRQVPSANGVAWLAQAYYFFKLNPKVWLISIFVMMLIMLILPLLQIFTPVFYRRINVRKPKTQRQTNF